MKPTIQRPTAICALALLVGTTIPAEAGLRARNIRQNINVRSNVNVRRDLDVRRNVNVRRDIDIDIDRHHHHGGFAAGVGVGMVTGLVVGAVATPPRNHTTVVYGGTTYAYAGGAYYTQGPSGYVVAAPPVGVIVPTLPPGATATIVNGQTFFLFNGLYYQPVLVNGATAFRTVAF